MTENYLAHYGKKGMKWRKRKKYIKDGEGNYREEGYKTTLENYYDSKATAETARKQGPGYNEAKAYRNQTKAASAKYQKSPKGRYRKAKKKVSKFLGRLIKR